MIRVLLLTSALLTLPALAAEPPPGTHPPTVTVITATRGMVKETVPIIGTMVAREEVMVSAQSDGLAIVEILAEEGDRVRAGQVLARLARDVLDTSLAQNAAQIARAEASVAQARGNIAEAQANRVQADAALARTRDLVGSGAASRETFDQRQAAAQTSAARLVASQAALQSAAADLALAQAQHREMLVRLAHTDIAAPVAGIVSRRVARLGAISSLSGEPLFRLIRDGEVELEADVPEVALARLRAGQPAQVFAAGQPTPLAGQVRLVSPEVNRTSRLGRVRIALAAGDVAHVAHVAIGSFARAAIDVARREGVVVPLSAVLSQPDGERVEVVRNGVVETRAVRVGVRDADRAEIEDGLAVGDQVIAVSGSFVRGGDRVTPVPAAPAPATTAAVVQ